MIAAIIASFSLGLLAILCAGIGEVADNPRAFRIAAAVFAIAAVSIGFLP
jgi:hypothetical protein